MEKILNKIIISSTSKRIDDILALESKNSSYTYHFNQNEESFIKLETEFTVPHFPIHHDSELDTPKRSYMDALEDFLKQIIPNTASIFSNLRYFFNPAEIFHPCFYQIYKYKEQLYLFLIRLDLIFKPSDGTIVEPGSNDVTNAYKTTKLYLESDLIPLSEYTSKNGKVSGFIIEQNISETWIGETGRGYLHEGIWIDQELTKYLSKLFMSNNKKSYPYYPFTCKYRTFCHTVTDLSPNGRKKHLLYLHTARAFILPLLDKIQDALKQESFSSDLPAFQEMKARVPKYWEKVWQPLNVKRYLNNSDMKEFLIEF